MAILTYTEQLEEVQAAITAILTGAQEYSVGSGISRSVKRADLGALQEREKYLRPLAAREGRSGGIRIRGITPSR
jgi:hypothetical protein